MRAVRPDLPPALAEVIRHAMAKRREERYPTAGALAKALAAAIREGRFVSPEETAPALKPWLEPTRPVREPITAAPGAPTAAPTKPAVAPQRRLWPLAAIGVVVLLLAGSLGWWG